MSYYRSESEICFCPMWCLTLNLTTAKCLLTVYYYEIQPTVKKVR